jgi:hypothetical protein
MRSTSLLTTTLALLAAGCPGESYDDTNARGDLGQGVFVYGCLGDTDVACASTNDPEWPRAVAVSGFFDVRFAGDFGGVQPTVIAPVADFAKKSSGGFLVLGEGTFALFAVNGNREVIDIKHVRAEAIHEVRVQRGRELPSRVLSLAVGDAAELLGTPYDAAGLALAGALDYAWTSDDDAVLSVESLGDLRRVKVKGVADGRASLHVTVGGADFVIDVTVGDGPSATPAEDAGSGEDAGDPELDAGADAGAELDGGAA